MKYAIPKEIKKVAAVIRDAGFEAYLVGGCVRDLLRGTVHGELVEPKDWDIATNAKPEEVRGLFADTVYENEFGTVGVKTDAEDPALKIVEVTTYRIEGRYSDKRHPDEIKFAKTLAEDLSRRDFTINAMALGLSTKHEAQNSKQLLNSKSKSFKHSDFEFVSDFGFRISDFLLVDPFGGRDDLKNRIIRTVGKPEERFREDALRLMRAVRFATELDFQIDFETRRAIEQNANLFEMIAKERVRDELIKMLMTERAAAGIILLEELNLLTYVLPELREGLGVGQNKHHIYTVFEHNIKALDYTAKKNYSLLVRVASLLHDVGKPKVKQGDGPDSTFYNHESVGAKMALVMLDRLRFPKDFVEQAAHLVGCHLFYYNVGEVTEAGVRRFLTRVGPENVEDLIKVREADRIGSGVPKAVPYKIRHLLFMIEKVKNDPISAKMLKVNGEDVMKITNIPASPKVGQILAILLEEVLENPERNDREKLETRVRELAEFSEADLVVLAKKAKGTKEEFESGVEAEMKKKYYVR